MWHLLGGNEFLMTLNIILRWCDYPNRANYFGFCDMYGLMYIIHAKNLFQMHFTIIVGI